MRPFPLIAALLPAGCDRPIYPPRDEIIAYTLARFDDDGDGTIGRLEFEAFASIEPGSLGFDDLDLDHDGAISADELDAMIREREPRPLVDKKVGPREAALTPARFYEKAPRIGRIP